MKIRYIAFLLVLLTGFAFKCQAQPFIHPGLLQNTEDIIRMKAAIAARQQPVYDGFVLFQSHPQSQSNYKMQGPMPMVGRNPTVGQAIYDADANAAYQNALMWALTGDKAYADKAKEIVNGWASTLKSITGRDAVLMAGLGPFKMVNAAEILRYSNAGWSAADIAQTEKHFKEIIYPVIKDYAPFANGNWDAAALKTAMAIAIFCNDRPMYEKTLRYYVAGAGDGSLTNYIINDLGQCQESGRDQGHTQLGIAHLGDCAEMAWHQGLNLYAYADNRLLKGFEYTAKYNLMQDVPYTPAMDRTGKYLHPQISVEGRGKIRAVYEEIYNHYVNRMGLTAPYTQQAAEKIRPEPQGLPGADHVGFGTLLYTKTPAVPAKDYAKVPVAPAGIIAKTTLKAGNIITWIAPVGAEGYTVKRAAKKAGPYRLLSTNIKTTHFTDGQAIPGKTYYYSIAAVNKKGQSSDALPIGITTGLPKGWKFSTVGHIKTGYAAFNNSNIIIDGEGMQADSVHDQAQLLHRNLTGNGSITVRCVPQISSQFTGFGVMMREGVTDSAAHISLMITPQSGNQIEAPVWSVKLIARVKPDAMAKIVATGTVLANPTVTFSRLTGYCWLRLVRKGNEFTAFSSIDGIEWTKVAATTHALQKQLLIGMEVFSGIKGVSSTVTFDNLKID